MKGVKFDTFQTMKYYRSGVLGSFVPENFNHPEEAHEYFVKKFLKQVDVIDILDPDKDKLLARIMNNSSEAVRPTFQEKLIYHGSKLSGVRLKITWYKSTASLTQKQFNQYINDVIVFGETELGIEVQDSKEWKKNNATLGKK